MSTRYRNAIIMTVEPGAPFPKPNSDIKSVSPMTGIEYTVHVRRILELHWGKDGAVIVALAGEKQVLPQMERDQPRNGNGTYAAATTAPSESEAESS